VQTFTIEYADTHSGRSELLTKITKYSYKYILVEQKQLGMERS
jgi:hypothetical protein